MRFAVISDIHGNLAALDATLAAIDRAGITQIANLGDSLSGPLDPAGTAGWVSADARITWQDMTGWQIAAGVDNLLDARYRVHGSGIDAVGRNLYLTLRYAY